MPTPETDAELATRLAVETGRLLVETRRQLFEEGASTWDVKDVGDEVARTSAGGCPVVGGGP